MVLCPSTYTTSTGKEHEYKAPSFYAAYLLKPVKEGSLRTYVGSSPDPPRRIRQHNGEVKGGAHYTKMWKPWHMEMIVYGFPSKLAALQFEWAWAHPDKSRNLRKENSDGTFTPFFPKGKKSNQPDFKVGVAHKMLSLPPYSRLPLCVRLFSRQAIKAFNALPSSTLPSHVQVVQDLGGVDGSRAPLLRPPGLKGVDPKTGKIDVTDAELSTASWDKFNTIITSAQLHVCGICGQKISDGALKNHLLIAICPSPSLDCLSISHLPCLAKHFQDNAPEAEKNFLLPRWGKCPGSGCNWEGAWGEVVRGCCGRNRLERMKNKVKGRGKGKGKAVDVDDDEEEEEEEEEEDDSGGGSEESENENEFGSALEDTDDSDNNSDSDDSEAGSRLKPRKAPPSRGESGGSGRGRGRGRGGWRPKFVKR